MSQSNNIPLVFIHGIKGSVLIDSPGSQRWLTLTQALSLRLRICAENGITRVQDV